MGGYIPLSEHIEGHNDAFRFKNLSAEEIKTTFLKETIDGEKTVQKSDDLILCLVQTPKNSPLPNGAYERVSYTGQLYADGDNKFVQLITDSSETTEKTYSYDDIKKTAHQPPSVNTPIVVTFFAIIRFPPILCFICFIYHFSYMYILLCPEFFFQYSFP